jgi:hypothetical protein
VAYVELPLGRVDDASGKLTHVPCGLIRDLLLAALLPGGQTLRGPAPRGFARVDLLVSQAGEGARLEQFEREGEVDIVFSL